MRDVAVFQLKLLLDGLRDALLLPVSLFVALLDVLGVGPRAGRQFYARTFRPRPLRAFAVSRSSAERACASSPSSLASAAVSRSSSS